MMDLVRLKEFTIRLAGNVRARHSRHARQPQKATVDRLTQFALTLRLDKTHRIACGRRAAVELDRTGLANRKHSTA